MFLTFILKYKKLYLLCAALFFTAFFFLFSQIKFREDASEMLPASFSQELKLFQNSPLSNKIFVVIESQDPQHVQTCAAQASAAFLNNGKIKFTAPRLDGGFLLSYYYSAPNIWNKNFEDKILPLLNREAISSKMEENIRLLYSPEGIFSQNFILADPLGMIPVFTEELKKLNFSGDALQAQNGVLISTDGKKALLIFDYEKNFLDAGGAREINVFFEEFKRGLPESVRAFYMGAPRYTFENSSIINKDIKKIFLIAGILMSALFIFLLRDKKALLIYFLPSAIVAVAGVITSFIFNGISGITIGFGAVLMGLCIDYSVYIYFALKAVKEEDRFQTVRLMFKPIAVSAATSVAGFLLLLLSDTAVLNQIAFFCASGLTTAFFIALFIMPFVFNCGGEATDRSWVKAKTNGLKNGIRAKTAICYAVIILICFVSVIGFKCVKFNSSFESLNTVSKEFEKDKEIFENLTGDAYKNNEFLFVFGDTKEEALENNERIAADNKDLLPLQTLFPSSKQRAVNLSEWKKFWSSGKAAAVKSEINEVSKKYNINPKIFDAFYLFLNTGQISAGQTDFNLEQAYNPVIEYGGKYAFVNIVKKNTGKAIQNAGIKTVLISNDILSAKIKTELFGSFYRIVLLIVLCSFIMLALLLKNIKSAVLAMIPPVCGLGLFFAAAALFKVEINIFGIFAMPLLIALGIDYGIFIIFQGKQSHANLHPSKAVIIAALSTLIGFGSLMAAQHKVLFIIGFMVFIGILTSILVSLFIIPVFLDGKVKSKD